MKVYYKIANCNNYWGEILFLEKKIHVPLTLYSYSCIIEEFDFLFVSKNKCCFPCVPTVSDLLFPSLLEIKHRHHKITQIRSEMLKGSCSC